MTVQEWDRQSRRVFALLREAKIKERAERLNLFRWILADPTITSTNDLALFDLRTIADTLSSWQRAGELEAQARTHCGPQPEE